jgi:hypothetical protein
MKELCEHCRQPILPSTLRDENGEPQWWHANPTLAYRPPQLQVPAYRRCYGDPEQPFAEPAHA